MKPWAYYNEHDPFAAAWLRELIRDNLIAPGEVDERDIEDVCPDELRSFRQCHFFAGVGVWSIAARLAGFDDDEALWSGSAPCQPFSAAGKGEGFADERHVWPSFHYLAEQCSPPLIVGEQVTGADGDLWLDLVSADMDATGYAFGAVETCAAGFGAPHERSRNYWMADRLVEGLERHARHVDDGGQPGRIGAGAVGSAPARGLPRGMADDDGERRGEAGRRRRSQAGSANDVERDGAALGVADAEHDDGRTDEPLGGQDRRAVDGGRGGALRMADPSSERRLGRGTGETGAQPRAIERLERFRYARVLDDALGDGWRARWNDYALHVRHELDATGGERVSRLERPGPVNGLWRDADWLRCRDDWWRPVESGTFPLAAARAFRNRVGLLRGAGNAVNLAQAAGFLVAVRAATGRG